MDVGEARIRSLQDINKLRSAFRKYPLVDFPPGEQNSPWNCSLTKALTASLPNCKYIEVLPDQIFIYPEPKEVHNLLRTLDRLSIFENINVDRFYQALHEKREDGYLTCNLSWKRPWCYFVCYYDEGKYPDLLLPPTVSKDLLIQHPHLVVSFKEIT